MKIIVAGPAYPYRGGLAAYNERLARQFADEGHDIEIITFTLQYPSILFPGKTQYNAGSAPEGLKIQRLINSINPFNWISAGLKIRRAKPDILLLRYWIPFMAPSLGTIARIVSGNRHTVVLCLFDNVIPHEKRPGDRLLTHVFTRSIDAGITMSQSVYDDLKQFNPQLPVTLTPHPIFDNFGENPGRESSLERLGLDSRYRYMLFFGFIRSYKGLDLLLEAFAGSVARESKQAKLLVAGEFYEDDEKYRKIITENGMQDDVLLFDRFINDDEVKFFFGASDIIVQPYKSATQSGVTQIAYHFNKPMIVTDVGGLAEMVPDGKCGFVTSSDNDSVRAAIDRFFSGDFSDVFKKGIEEQKQTYSWDKMTLRILDLVSKVNNTNKL